MGDIFGDHVVSYAGILGIKHRHNVGRDTLVDVCYESEIFVRKEVDIGLSGGNDEALQPSDVLFYYWDWGRDVCVDLTRSSPLIQSRLSDFVPGQIVADAANHKRVKYKADYRAIDYGFLPFSFSSLRKLDKDALLKRVQELSRTQDIKDRTAAYIFTGIDFAIVKGMGPKLYIDFPLLFCNLINFQIFGKRN
ncbi:hypothetical protein OROHE_025772 [Orobanche hederae]